MNERLKRICVITSLVILLIICIGTMINSLQYIQDSKEMCQAKCEELNLTLKQVHWEGEPWIMKEVKSCDCKIPDYVRIKVKT